MISLARLWLQIWHPSVHPKVSKNKRDSQSTEMFPSAGSLQPGQNGKNLSYN